MRPILMGAVSSKSSSISLATSTTSTGLEAEMQRMDLCERGKYEAEKAGEEEDVDERLDVMSSGQRQFSENLLRQSSSHILVTANSSADHLNFIRF